MDWSYFWLIVSGNALATVALGFLMKSLIEQKLKEQQSLFDHQLESERNARKETFETKLAAFSHRHSLLAEKQADAIASVYARLLDLRDSIEAMEYYGTQEDLCARLESAKAVYRDCEGLYKRNRILFSAALSKQIHETVLLLWDLSRSIFSLHRLPSGSDSYDKRIDKNDALQIQVPRTLEALEDAFRSALHGAN